MNHRVHLTLFGAAAIAIVAAGCTGAPTTTPAIPATPSISGPTLPHSGAPKVEHPLPASVLSGDPCQQALTPDQVKKVFGSVVPSKRDDLPSLGPACNWTNSDTGAVLGISYTTQVHDGLSAVYANTKPRASLWKELPPIQGFPAIADVAIGAEAEKDFCEVSIGIRDDLTADVSLNLGNTKVGKAAPCDVAAQIADMLVTNLRQKAGA